MPLYTKKEFAEKCGMKTNQLSVYIKRKKVVVGANEMIDTKIEANKSFLQKQSGNRSEAQLLKDIQVSGPAPFLEPKKQPSSTPPIPDFTFPADSEVTSGIPSYTESERKLKYLDTLKREQEVNLLKIKEEKMKGMVVPSELIKPVLLQHNQSILSEFKNATEEILRVFAKKRDLLPEEIADMRGAFTNTINEAITKAAAVSIKSIEGIIDNFTETRGKGERV